MRTFALLAAAGVLAFAAPASAQPDRRSGVVAVTEDGRPVLDRRVFVRDDRRDFRDDRRDFRDDRRDFRDDRRDFRDDRRDFRDDDRDFRDDRRDFRDDRRDFRDDRRDFRDDFRDDRRDERQAFRDGFRQGRRFDDRFEDRRVYRQGFRDGRRFDRYDYRPFFGPRFDWRRHSYYRYDRFDGPWRRPYVIGRPLPRGVGFRRLDPYYYRGLPPCPRGFYYADVGGDILLIALATGIVADALIY